MQNTYVFYDALRQELNTEGLTLLLQVITSNQINLDIFVSIILMNMYIIFSDNSKKL